jgi:hypothetical protein
MLNLILRIFAGAAVALALPAVPSNAVTLTTPSGSATDAYNLYSTTLATGGTYVTGGFRSAGANPGLDDYYSLSVTSAQLVVTTVSARETDPGAAVPFGTAGLTGDGMWPAAGPRFTRRDGATEWPATLVAILTADRARFSQLRPTTSAGDDQAGGRTEAKKGVVSPIPLPASVILLGTALGGLVIIFQRRRTT